MWVQGRPFQARYRWTNTQNLALPPGGFHLIWADNDLNQNGRFGPGGDLHCSFKIRTNDTIRLIAPDASYTNAVTLSLTNADTSQGRYPDGQSWQTIPNTNPTPRQPNTP